MTTNQRPPVSDKDVADYAEEHGLSMLEARRELDADMFCSVCRANHGRPYCCAPVGDAYSFDRFDRNTWGAL